MSDLSSTMAAPDSSLSAALRAVAERGALALVAALGTNAFIVWVVRATAVVESLPQLAYAPVSVLTAVGVIGASVVYAVLDWRFSRPVRPFAIITWVVLLVSFVPNLVALPNASTGAIAILMFMHVTVAVICYVSLTR